jgi:hypothetical protein
MEKFLKANDVAEIDGVSLTTVRRLTINKEIPCYKFRKALFLLKSEAKHVLLFGGSQSGKTTVLVMAIIFCALFYAGSRHLICRYRTKDARSSFLRETLITWLTNTVRESEYTYLVHGRMINLYNGSEIWIGGLGDREKERISVRQEYPAPARVLTPITTEVLRCICNGFCKEDVVDFFVSVCRKGGIMTYGRKFHFSVPLTILHWLRYPDRAFLHLPLCRQGKFSVIKELEYGKTEKK